MSLPVLRKLPTPAFVHRKAHDVSLEVLAERVRRGDPDRFRAAMTAPPAARGGLMALYAFNLEIARAPWATSEAMLAEIRLRWWLDALAEVYAGQRPRRHEVVEPLAEAIRGADLPQRLFVETIEARAFDADPAPHPDRAAVDRHIARTAGHVMELAARHLGAPEASLPVVREFAQGAGTAQLLRALPELRARGRDPLPPGLDVAALVADGRAALGRARARRAEVPSRATPALLAGWQADAILARAAGDSAAESLEPAPFRARLGLLVRGLSGRW
jgi:15-cis-phytoene synthase